MKNKIKYGIAFIIILLIGIISINIYQPNKEQTLRGKIEIIAYDDVYDYLVECANKFMELNDKTTVTVKKIYSSDAILQELNNKDNSRVTSIAQINRMDFDILGLKKSNYLEEQQNILNTYSKNFSTYRLQQTEYDDISVGIPFTSRPLALYIREDMLEEYGYNRDEMNTWDDVIKIGKDIFEKSNGNVRIINATGDDYEDLVSLLIMQYMGKENNEELVKNQVNNMMDQLKNNNILNLTEGGEFLGRISSINAVKEIVALDVKCQWTAENVPSITHGTNKFFSSEGDNFVVLNDIVENRKLVEKFITYVMTNNSEAIEYVAQGRFFSSYLYTYKNKDSEVQLNNFIGMSPMVVLSNVEEKTRPISNYEEYINIKKTILNK